MKILVPIKRVPDYQAKIKIKTDGSGVETGGIKWIVNPFDEIAVEAAIKFKEEGKASEVVVVTVGPLDAATQLRYAMAMGADSAIHVTTDAYVDSDLASRVLVEVFKKGEYGLIIMGKQSIDSDANQTGQLMAARLNMGQGCFASSIKLFEDKVAVTREVDGGLETLEIPLPCVITTDLRLNQPRYASLPGIMKAKKKPLDEIAIESLGIEVTNTVKVLKLTAPQKRKGGRRVADVVELVRMLSEEAKVL